MLCALPLFVVTVSGTILAVDQSAAKLPIASTPPLPVSPLRDEEIAALFDRSEMVRQASLQRTTLTSIKVRRVGQVYESIYWTKEALPFARVYDLRTGREVTPETLGLSRFVLPWHWHQLLKRVHNGSIIGLPGRLFDLLMGIAICFLAVSGGTMFFDLYNARRRKGRTNPFWR